MPGLSRGPALRHRLRVARLYCLAHGVFSGLGLWVLASVLVLAVGEKVLAVDLLASRPSRPLPVAELIAVASASLIPAITHPQMWTWEQLRRRVALRVAGTAYQSLWLAMAGLLPLLVPLTTVQPASPWAGSTANVLLIASLAALGAMLIGRAIGPLIAIACYLALLGLQQASDVLYSILPLADFAGTRGPAWAIAGGLCAAAALAAGATLGRARLAQDRARNDDAW